MDTKREDKIRAILGGEGKCRLCGGPRGYLDGARLRAKREAADVGLSELARRVSISVPYLSDLELGRRNLGIKVADKLLKGLGL